MSGGTERLENVLVTGASRGLGLALARTLIERTDHRLILTAREGALSRFGRAGIMENERIVIRPLDVTEPGDRRRLVSEIEERWGGVDVLINNAGVSYRSVVEHVSERERLAQMKVNFRSPMELIRLVLPSMRRKRAGRIINVSSVGGMMAMPTMGVYSASKFALEGSTEALWYEVRPWNIHVSLVEPGFIHSSSFQRVRLTDMSARSVSTESDPYYHHYEHMSPFIERMMDRTTATPEKVAKTIVKTMVRRRPPLRVPATWDAWLFSLLRRFLPRRFYHWLLYRSLPRISEWGEPLVEPVEEPARLPERAPKLPAVTTSQSPESSPVLSPAPERPQSFGSNISDSP